MENSDKEFNELFNRMSVMCSRAEHCSPEIRKKLKELGAGNDLQDKIISTLEKEGFLDDVRFIGSYVADKFRLNKWGKIKIRYYLKMKGLPDKQIEAGLSEINVDAYIKTLIGILKEKEKSIRKKPPYEKMGQLIRFAQSRGFEPELIHRHLTELK